MTSDGNYLQMVVSELALGDITSASTDTSIVSPSNSFVFKWNGTDTGYTSMITYPGTALSACVMFGDNQYIFGYDFRAGGVYNPIERFITSSPNSAYGEAPLPNAVASMNNLVTWFSNLWFDGVLEGVYGYYGTISTYEYKPGYWCPLAPFANSPETDVIRIPCQILVSNYAQGASTNGYTSQIFGTPKIYYSSLETSDSPTTVYRFYKWSPAPTGLGTAMIDALYQTQTQLFSKKVNVSEIRVYGEPWVANNVFKVSLIGSSGDVISGSDKTFTAGSNLTVGSDFAWYNPTIAPTYAIGLRIENKGTVNHTINKVEIDYANAGK
jgi:hypothetical protein